jgi:cell pole-organizing protein PopZ
VSRSVRVGHDAVLAEVDEQSPEVVDSAMERLGGTVLRRSLDDVEAEITAAEDAQRAAKQAARKRLHEQRREQRKEKVQQKIAELKSKLHIDHPAGAKTS